MLCCRSCCDIISAMVFTVINSSSVTCRPRSVSTKAPYIGSAPPSPLYLYFSIQILLAMYLNVGVTVKLIGTTFCETTKKYRIFYFRTSNEFTIINLICSTTSVKLNTVKTVIWFYKYMNLKNPTLM